MKESTAWRNIAEHIAEYGVISGLFHKVMMSGEDTHLQDVMEVRVVSHMSVFNKLGNPDVLVHAGYGRLMPETTSAYFDDRGVAESRILAALFLALEAKDEGN